MAESGPRARTQSSPGPGSVRGVEGRWWRVALLSYLCGLWGQIVKPSAFHTSQGRLDESLSICVKEPMKSFENTKPEAQRRRAPAPEPETGLCTGLHKAGQSMHSTASAAPNLGCSGLTDRGRTAQPRPPTAPWGRVHVRLHVFSGFSAADLTPASAHRRASSHGPEGATGHAVIPPEKNTFRPGPTIPKEKSLRRAVWRQ